MYYRGCWHIVSRCFFCRYLHFRLFPAERGLQPEGLQLPREHWDRISELVQQKADSYRRDYERAVNRSDDAYAEVLLNEYHIYQSLANELSL